MKKALFRVSAPPENQFGFYEYINAPAWKLGGAGINCGQQLVSYLPIRLHKTFFSLIEEFEVYARRRH